MPVLFSAFHNFAAVPLADNLCHANEPAPSVMIIEGG